ncbi:MAG: Gfo/Idh/MocA family oxidoreductase [Roseibium sp.]
MRLLILGTGSMAHSHVEAYQAIPGVEVVAGVDRREDVLAEFCEQFGISNRFSSLDDAIAWGNFDAVSNVTPDAAHHSTTLQLLAANKHVLCEKPLATNAGDALEMAQEARNRGRICMVNLTYRNVAALQKAATLVQGGAIGDLRHFEASYLQSWLTQPAWGDWQSESQWLWRLSTAHGSKGVLGDVGIHILDFVTFAAGSPTQEIACRLKTFDKAKGGKIDDYVLDANDSFTMQAELANGAIGTISASRFASGHLNDLRLRLYGDRGGLEVSFENQISRLRICDQDSLESADWRDIELEPVPTVYQRFITAIRAGQSGEPDFDHGARLQIALDLAEQSHQDGGRFLKVNLEINSPQK